MKRLAAELMMCASVVALHAAPDATHSLIFINEDWYGHQNSTVNVLRPDAPDGDYWQYRVIQEANPGVELGCTAQHGQLWNGRLYVVCKQEKDPGADIAGGRVNIFDANDFSLIAQLERIDPSGAQCDGRGFLGVDDRTGYVSTSNGVWILDLIDNRITGQVAGTMNPHAGGDNDKPNNDPSGALYHGQCGMMVKAAGRVFVAHQQYGVLVVDPKLHEVTDVVSMDCVAKGAGIGSIVKSNDGDLWLSVAANVRGTGATLPYIVRLDPNTLETETVAIGDGMNPPANSWYAWTPDAFVASATRNCLYWKGGANRWFSGSKIYKFDCDSRQCTLHIDLEADGDNWKLYGCSMGVDPVSDEMYLSLYHEFSIPVYVVRRYDASGQAVNDYPMIQNYWFPSLPLFVDEAENRITEVATPPECTERFYDLQGRRVNAPCRGLFVSESGRKVLFR